MHTFDIRFVKSVGLAGLFEAPANTLGWRGAGRLSIDPQGISIAVKRGVLTLFSRRARRFSADSLTEAYREGNSLRLVFKSKDKSEVLPVWTRGGDQAAELVKLLPTLRTVELDHATGAHRFRPDWRVISLAVIALIAAGGVSLVPLPRSSESPDVVASVDGPAASPVSPSTTGSPVADVMPAVGPAQAKHPAATTADGNAAVPARSGDMGFEEEQAAPEYVDSSEGYIAESGASAFSATESPPVVVEQDARPQVGANAPHIDTMQWLLNTFEAQSGKGLDDVGWWQFTVRVHTTPEFQEHELWAMREAMLAISRAWRAQDVEFAQELTRQLHLMLRRMP